jgi:DNA-binding MarR family transcriptional regulator
MASSTKLKSLALTSCSVGAEELKVHPQLKVYLSYCLYKGALRLRAMMNEALEPYGLISPQVGMLALLKSLGAINQMGLGREMGIDKATMVKLIDGLEKRGLVKRIQGTPDRRAKMLQITTKGERHLEELSHTRAKVEARFLEPLSKSEQALLRKVMPKLLR